MKLRFYNRIHWRGLLPGLWCQWENTALTVVLYLDGPLETDTSVLSLEATFEIPEGIERWLLPRYERWAREREWIT